jgi:hypothetical protein
MTPRKIAQAYTGEAFNPDNMVNSFRSGSMTTALPSSCSFDQALDRLDTSEPAAALLQKMASLRERLNSIHTQMRKAGR